MSQEVKYIIRTCPTCNFMIQIFKSDLNCRIFRHGSFIDSKKQIPPHCSKQEVDQWIAENKIYGCGQPFVIDKELKILACDWNLTHFKHLNDNLSDLSQSEILDNKTSSVGNQDQKVNG